jgi:hypothetical protein
MVNPGYTGLVTGRWRSGGNVPGAGPEGAAPSGRRQGEPVLGGELGGERREHQQHPFTLGWPAATSASSVVAQAPAPQAAPSLPGSCMPEPATSESATTV